MARDGGTETRGCGIENEILKVVQRLNRGARKFRGSREGKFIRPCPRVDISAQGFLCFGAKQAMRV